MFKESYVNKPYRIINALKNVELFKISLDTTHDMHSEEPQKIL